jgi:hypothetical protein
LAKQKYLWLIERKIGIWNGWVSRGTRGPKPDSKGMMHFLKGQYSLDPKKFRRFKIPRGIKPGDNVSLQFWKEDEPIPLDFLDPEKKVGDDISSTMIQRLAKIKRFELMTATDKEIDPLLILAILSILGNLIAIGFLVSRSV